MQLQQGAILQKGKYKIDRLLGQGGFGITYLAFMKVEVQGSLGMITTELKVAVKEFFMKELCKRDPDTSLVSVPSSGSQGLVEKFRQKFIKEACNISMLHHPNIIKVLEVFEENGTAYYVMEYVDGVSINQKVNNQGALPLDEALHYFKQIASALDYIHQKKINHLDVKPANILLRNGDAVLIDFGLSKQYDDSGEQTSSTPVGVSIGYAPIEQSTQGGVKQFSASTDIYSLGATLYKMVTGKRPPDASEVMNEGLPSFPSIVGKEVVAAIQKAMSPGRRERPQNIKEFLKLFDLSVQEEVASKKGHKKTLLIYLFIGFCTICLPFMAWIYFSGKGQGKVPSTPTVFEGSIDTLQIDSVAIAPPVHPLEVNQPQQIIKEEPPITQVQRRSEPPRADVQRVTDEQQQLEEQRIVEEQKRLEEERIIEEQKRADEQKQADEKALQQANEQKRQLLIDEIYQNLIYVEGGSFMMGSSDSESLDWEKPVHKVTLNPFYLSKYEVTQELWRAVMGSNPSHFKGDQLPVEQVSWNDVHDFISKLNAQTGKLYRLPTEAEWEYAAKGGNRGKEYKYSGGNTIDIVAWYDANSANSTNPVGTKSINELGICDMSGNVWEWCSDWYGPYSSTVQTNPLGPSSGTNRVYRGGGWNSGAKNVRVSHRSFYAPDTRSATLGFRLACTTK